TALSAALRNFPIRPVGWLLWALVFPLGRRAVPPGDRLSHRVAALLMAPNEARDRLAQGVFLTPGPNNPGGRINSYLAKAIAAEPVERKFLKALKNSDIEALDFRSQLDEGVREGWITAEERAPLEELRELTLDAAMVDDFDTEELRSAGYRNLPDSERARREAARPASAPRGARRADRSRGPRHPVGRATTPAPRRPGTPRHGPASPPPVPVARAPAARQVAVFAPGLPQGALLLGHCPAHRRAAARPWRGHHRPPPAGDQPPGYRARDRAVQPGRVHRRPDHRREPARIDALDPARHAGRVPGQGGGHDACRGHPGLRAPRGRAGLRASGGGRGCRSVGQAGVPGTDRDVDLAAQGLTPAAPRPARNGAALAGTAGSAAAALDHCRSGCSRDFGGEAGCMPGRGSSRSYSAGSEPGRPSGAFCRARRIGG